MLPHGLLWTLICVLCQVVLSKSSRLEVRLHRCEYGRVTLWNETSVSLYERSVNGCSRSSVFWRDESRVCHGNKSSRIDRRHAYPNMHVDSDEHLHVGFTWSENPEQLPLYHFEFMVWNVLTGGGWTPCRSFLCDSWNVLVSHELSPKHRLTCWKGHASDLRLSPPKAAAVGCGNVHLLTGKSSDWRTQGASCFGNIGKGIYMLDNCQNGTQEGSGRFRVDGTCTCIVVRAPNSYTGEGPQIRGGSLDRWPQPPDGGPGATQCCWPRERSQVGAGYCGGVDPLDTLPGQFVGGKDVNTCRMGRAARAACLVDGHRWPSESHGNWFVGLGILTVGTCCCAYVVW